MSSQQPVKDIGSLIDTNYNVIDPTATYVPGTTVDIPTLTPSNPAMEADYLAMYNLTGGHPALLQQFLTSLGAQNGGLSGDIQGFAKQYVAFLVAQGALANDPVVISTSIKKVLDGFAKAFLASISFSNSAESGVLRALFPSLASYADGDTSDAAQLSMLSAMWQKFSAGYVYQPNGAIANGSTTLAQGFFQQLRNFTAVTATITTGFVVKVNNGGSGLLTATAATTPSFKAIYDQYFPGSTTAAFASNFQDFARSMIQSQGFFSASRQYTEYVSFVQQQANVAPAAKATLPTQSVTILNDVFFLIVSMISSIQNITASQANRLSLYTSWQKGYTDLLNQVHIFTASSGDLLRDGGPYGDTKARRQDEQGNFNAGVTQQITAYKDSVSEDAKALQSRVNASSDAFNEQANTATAILQEISTILSAIFR